MWRYRWDGSMEYQVETCMLHRFTQAEARRCLAGHHMLMIGDSISRYQYLSLIHFMEHGKWPPRFGRGSGKNGACTHIDAYNKPTCSPADQPNPVMEGDWADVYGHAADKSWKQMHMHFGGKGFNGRLECQCVRNQSDSGAENMFYEYIGNSSHSPAGDADQVGRVTFLNSLTNTPMTGWKRNHCSRSGTCELTEDTWYKLRARGAVKDYDYSYDIERDGESFYAALDDEGIAPGVDIALYNRGAWGWVPAAHEHVQKVMSGLFRVTKKHGGKCFWKGTTAAPFGNNMNEGNHWQAVTFWEKEQRLRTTAYGAGCGVYDLAHVTKEFQKFEWVGDFGRPSCCGESEGSNVFWDSVHFRPWVYEEFNNILLNVLC